MKASRSPVLDLLNLLLHLFLHALGSSTRPSVSRQEGDELNARSGSTLSQRRRELIGRKRGGTRTLGRMAVVAPSRKGRNKVLWMP